MTSSNYLAEELMLAEHSPGCRRVPRWGGKDPQDYLATNRGWFMEMLTLVSISGCTASYWAQNPSKLDPISLFKLQCLLAVSTGHRCDTCCRVWVLLMGSWLRFFGFPFPCLLVVQEAVGEALLVSQRWLLRAEEALPVPTRMLI